jgi:3-phytase
MTARSIVLGALLLGACAPSPEPVAETGRGAPSVAAELGTDAIAHGSATDPALWVHPTDATRSLVLGATGIDGLEAYSLDGHRVGAIADIEALFVDVIEGFDLGGQTRPLVLALDSRDATLLSYVIDPETRAFDLVSARPLAIGDEGTGLCGYTSRLSGAHYAFVITPGGIQQWELYARDDDVDGRLVRTLGASSDSVHCVVDGNAGALYYSEEPVGVWRVAAEPETEGTREPVDLAAPFGKLGDETKGLALDASGAHLIVSDVAEGRLHLYRTTDGTRAASFALDGIEEAEGLALGLQGAQGGWLVIADERDSGSDFKLVPWEAVAHSLAASETQADAAQPPARAATVQPTAETAPVDSFGDAADDAAIWVHPTDPAQSLVITSQKKRGVYVYDLAGREVQVLPDGRMNNVDLRYDFPFAGGRAAIVATTNRSTDDLSLYRVDAAARRLIAVGGTPIPTGLADPYGLCMYRSASTGDYYVYASDTTGRFRQWQLRPDAGGGVTGEVVRELDVGSQAEGCAADDEQGSLYIGEEDVGLWKYAAEPDGGSERKSIDQVETGHLTADVEGVAIYYGDAGTGYVVVSNQGEDNYALYRRQGDNEYVGRFHVVANPALGIDGVSETDGLDVSSAALGPSFPRGLLVVQDGRNIAPRERQNFKYVSWERVLAALDLEDAKAEDVP